jgi:hypothetical protein
MNNSERYPSYVSCVAHLLSASSQPLSVDALISGIERQRPITKGARQAVHRAINQLFQAVPVAPNHYGWLSHLLSNNIFRHPLTSEEARRGFLLLDELEHAVFFPQFFQTYQPEERKLHIELMGEGLVEAEAYVERNTWSLRLGKEFIEWINLLGGQGRDDLLIMVSDATKGQYILRLQPHESRDENAIQSRNMRMAILAEEIIDDHGKPDEAMPTAELAARLIGKGFFHDSTPADDLHYVLHHYSGLTFRNGVGYAQEASAEPDMEQMFMGGMPYFTGDRTSDEASNLPDDPFLEPGEPMDDLFADGASPDFFDDACPDYEGYLQSFAESGRLDEPLSHSDYHLLEAELEMLISLEEEFGYLLSEQSARKDQLAERLFIDPEALLDDDMDDSDYIDFDEPPFWQN